VWQDECSQLLSLVAAAARGHPAQVSSLQAANSMLMNELQNQL